MFQSNQQSVFFKKNQNFLKKKQQKQSTLTKEKLISYIASKNSISSRDAKIFVTIVLEEIKKSLSEKSQVKILGFGKWIVKEKKTRIGRNPHTGKQINISARSIVSFHPSAKLKDLLNSKKDLVNSAL